MRPRDEAVAAGHWNRGRRAMENDDHMTREHGGEAVAVLAVVCLWWLP